LRGRVVGGRRRHTEEDDRVGIESGIDRTEIRHRLHEDTGANQQDERDRHLHDDQRLAET
jgi:hypothetical protein